jgi:hypothetical protein
MWWVQLFINLVQFSWHFTWQIKPNVRVQKYRLPLLVTKFNISKALAQYIQFWFIPPKHVYKKEVHPFCTKSFNCWDQDCFYWCHNAGIQCKNNQIRRSWNETLYRDNRQNVYYHYVYWLLWMFKHVEVEVFLRARTSIIVSSQWDYMLCR